LSKFWGLIAILLVAALGAATFLKSGQTGKTITLEPATVMKTPKYAKKIPSIKTAGNLEALTRDAPEPRPVTTDALVVPPKPVGTPTVTSVAASGSSIAPTSVQPASPEPASIAPTSVKPVSAEPVSAKPSTRVPETTTDVPKSTPEISSTKPKTIQNIQPSSVTPEQTAETVAPSPETPAVQDAPSLPLRRETTGVSVQAGAFKTATNAEALRAQLAERGFKTSVELGTDGISRVIVGPYSNETLARDAATKILGR
jgi:cell division protein FtsN